MRITYLGHATTLIELDGVALLTDPLLRKRVAHLVRLQTAAAPVALDAVLLSHLHADHLDYRSLAMLPPAAPIVLPARAGAFVGRRTRRDVVELAVGDETRVGELTVRAVRADHDDRRHPLSRRFTPLGFVITGSRTVYFAGDTDLFPEMAAFAPLDVALVPVWGWGPTLPPGHLDPGRAAEAVQLLRPNVAIPIHWGTYRVIGSKGSGVAPAERFRDEVARVAPGVEVRILQPGEATAHLGNGRRFRVGGARRVLARPGRSRRASVSASASAPWGSSMGFGSGVLISAVAYELVAEAFDTADGSTAVAIGLFAGCGTFFVGDSLIDRYGGAGRKSATGAAAAGGSALAIVLGIVLDGVPESAVIGLGLSADRASRPRCWPPSSSRTCRRRSPPRRASSGRGGPGAT